MPKVFSYVRFSSAKQSAGDSKARQIKYAKAFADEYGYELADPNDYLFFDAGRSAYKGKHLDDTGELARFLAFVEDGTIPTGSVLVIESLDRLSRERVRDALPRFLDLLAKGINVYTSIDKRLYTREYNEIDLIISIINMSRAHEESATKGSRVSSAWRNKHRQARESGKPIGKLRPLWLDVTPDGYVLNAERADVVRRMFHLTAEGYGSRVIAAKLNQEGIPAFSAGRKNLSGLWAFSTIRHILESRTVLGEYQPHIFIDGVRTPDGEPIAGFFPAAVTEDEYYLATAARASRRQYQVTKTTLNFNVMAGVLFCQRCDASMHLQASRGRKHFKCANKAKGMCGSGIVTTSRAELVFREVLAKIDSLSLVRTSSGSLTKQLQVVEGRIEELRAKQAEAEASHEEFPSRITARQLQQLESDLERLDSERTVLSQELATDNVLSKEDFFEKLDLISYGGRSAANNLVKRLGVRINVAKWGRLNEAYAVTVNTAPTFVIIHDKDDIAVRALDRASLDKLALHGDIDEETRVRLAAVGDLVKGVATQFSDQLIAQLRLRPPK
ncbi:Site-specific DNA recombinase [Pseudomonas syringae]|uniref:recombinase family protein n=1 Tax=Pseudomonas syringae TaxID=317 RepID=UPI0008946887|nr:recombinase family protein [Pseudomonas syringae]SDW30519.1 Site-specific DNA recombinase [Pseudomonas syringae]SFL49895.1 Site-specific DNA recombinase [Pseudomonas syringae]